jgi:hypothetical protein
MLTLIERLEAGTKKEELCLVNISGVSESGEQAAPEGYGKLLEIVEAVESKPQKISNAKQQIARQAQEKEDRKAAENVGAWQPSSRKDIKEEMGGIANGMPEAKPKFDEMKIKKMAEDLVLPNLPISDQMQELEQIVSALKEKAFNKEQVKVARTEIEGLQRYVNELGKELKREKKDLSALDKSLWDMRERRLKEAMSLIKKGV